jgi:O-antigen/teichoic acid export membrane protein
VNVGQGKVSAQEALSASLPTVAFASLIGAAAVLLYSVLQLPLEQTGIWAAVGVACLTVVIGAVAQLLVFVVYARHRIVAVSVLTIAMSATAAGSAVVFCAVFDLDVFGGILGGLVTAALGFVVATGLLAREHLRLRLRASRSYLRPALRFGLRTQLANLLAFSSARVDLLFVYALAKDETAGIYSVALTLGVLTSLVAVALSFASFPSMAAMTDDEALELTLTMARMAALLGSALAVVLAFMSSTVIGLLLGRAYGDAAGPTAILLFANVLWGVQWLLSRALAARGDPNLLVRSFAVNLIAMMAFDVILIPPAGAVGAATAALIGAACGLIICLRTYRRRGVRYGTFLPRPAELQIMRNALRQARRGMGRADSIP